MNLSNAEEESSHSVKLDEEAVKVTLSELRSQEVSLQRSSDSMSVSLDTFIWVNESLYIARPLIARYWLQRNAIKDARLIVQAIQQGA